MKCYNCGFENKAGVSFCHKCGVNLNNSEHIDDEDLNKGIKVTRKRQFYSNPLENFIKSKLMYKHDLTTGKLRLAKTKCVTLVVFCGFSIFGFLVSLLKFNIIISIFAGLIIGILFAIPVAVIGIVFGRVIDKIFH